MALTAVRIRTKSLSKLIGLEGGPRYDLKDRTKDVFVALSPLVGRCMGSSGMCLLSFVVVQWYVSVGRPTNDLADTHV